MEYNVRIDDEQQDKFVAPIFLALANHVDDETFMKIYFDTNLIQYSEFIPDHIMANPQFIKKAIKLNMLDYDRVPDKFKTQEFISKDD